MTGRIRVRFIDFNRDSGVFNSSAVASEASSR
jgi:hypothetical protein